MRFRRTTFAATRHVPWGSKYIKNAFAANAFLVYLEPRERVWWLQLSLSTIGGVNSAPVNPLLAGFEEPFEAGIERENGERGERERKERDGSLEKTSSHP